VKMVLKYKHCFLFDHCPGCAMMSCGNDTSNPEVNFAEGNRNSRSLVIKATIAVAQSSDTPPSCRIGQRHSF
jgi:hypothetical protein